MRSVRRRLLIGTLARPSLCPAATTTPMKKVRGRVFTPVYIRSSMISSLEGLRLSPDWRVQARAIVMSEAHIWDERNEEYERERLFIEAVCAFVDVAPERLLLLRETQ
jgi:hypothetical protein